MFRKLDGVEAAARVLQTKGNIVVSGRSIGQGTVMGIDNVDFSKVAWFRNDLFPAHPFNYLNFLGLYEQAAIIPSKVAEKYQLKLGRCHFRWHCKMAWSILSSSASCLIGRAQYPDQSPFIIANLDYIYDQVPIIPYDVWLKMKPGALTAPIMKQLQDKGIELAGVKDVRIELAAQAKHPTRGGVFGILSLGFLVSIIVSLTGYILFWFFNLSGRIVQFGVLAGDGTVAQAADRHASAGADIHGRAVDRPRHSHRQGREHAVPAVPADDRKCRELRSSVPSRIRFARIRTSCISSSAA